MNGAAWLYVSEIPRRDQFGADPGISVYQIDEEREKLIYLDKFPIHGITNVSCVDPRRRLLYVTAEEPDLQKQRRQGDRILVLKIDAETGELRELADEKPALSPNPVYVSLDKEREFLLAANHTTHNAVLKVEKTPDGEWRSRAVYDDSTVILYSLKEDGTIRRVEDVVIQEGSGPLQTQTHAHPHSVEVSPSGKLFAVCDKGADKVLLYEIDRKNRKMKSLGEPYRSHAGDEPRFCVFHPGGKYLYVNHEGNLGVDVLQYSETGALKHIQTVYAQPENLVKEPGRIYEHQGIAMHPSGAYLYSVARGIDAMAVFRVNQESGKLELIQLKEIPGAWPRCCQITPGGKWLVAGTRDGGDLILYRIEEDGMLTQTDAVKHSCGVAYVAAMKCSE